MRVLAVALVALVAVTSAARADDDDDTDEDGAFVPVPKLSLGVAFNGHGMRIHGRSESGYGLSAEIGLGRGRWQYLVEGGFAAAGMNAWTTGAADMRIDGRLLRGGLGARWIARQFRPDSKGAFELFLLSLVGAQRFAMDDGTRLSRPELAFGFGLQGRSFRRPRFAVRLEARVLFTPEDRDDAPACRGRCMEPSASTGFMGGIGVAW